MSSFREVNASRIAFHLEELAVIERRDSALDGELTNARIALARAQHAVDTMTQDRVALRSRRSALLDKIGELRSELDPQVMTSFPLELLREIFFVLAAAIDKDLYTREGSTIRRHSAQRALLPFAVSAVCRSWRAVALDSPSLWGSYLAPNPYADDAEKGSRALEYTNTVLCRSASSPLDVCVFWDDLEDAWTAPHSPLPRILDVIASQSQRWRSLFLLLPEVAATPHNLRIFRQATPLLQELAVTTDSTTSTNTWRDNFPAYLPHCPNLRLIETDLSHVIWTYPRTEKLMVTRMYLNYLALPAQAVWNILDASPLLAYLELGAIIRDKTWKSGTTLCLAALLELECSNDGGDLLALWAPCLALSRLSVLKLYACNILPLHDLFSSVSTTLTVLRLSYIRNLGREDLDCLAQLRNLANINFRECCSSDGISATFIERWSRIVAWPRLTRILISQTALLEPAAEAFLHLVRSRTVTPSSDVQRLTRVEFQSSIRRSVPRWLEDQVALLLPPPLL